MRQTRSTHDEEYTERHWNIADCRQIPERNHHRPKKIGAMRYRSAGCREEQYERIAQAARMRLFAVSVRQLTERMEDHVQQITVVATGRGSPSLSGVRVRVLQQ